MRVDTIRPGQLVLAGAIQLFAYAVFLYRFRGQGLSPDGKFYAAMAEGVDVPSPYARRWLLPMLLKSKRPWSIASGVAFVAVGPLVYALTDSLACVWLCAWLPGLAVNVRFPVLVDQVAFAAMLGAAVLCKHGQLELAMVALFVAASCKESAAVFGALLCPHWMVWVVGGVGLLGALAAGALSPAVQDQEYMLHPCRVAMTKHDPLCWRSMLLPWGGVLVLCLCTELEPTWTVVAAGLSVAVGYGQLLLANDECRLYQWAAPAVLIACAGASGWWLPTVLVLHPFVCGASKRV